MQTLILQWSTVSLYWVHSSPYPVCSLLLVQICHWSAVIGVGAAWCLYLAHMFMLIYILVSLGPVKAEGDWCQI